MQSQIIPRYSAASIEGLLAHFFAPFSMLQLPLAAHVTAICHVLRPVPQGCTTAVWPRLSWKNTTEPCLMRA
jgi:hypothetical protein